MYLSSCVFVEVGNNRSSFFREDRLLSRSRVQEIVPRLYNRIRPRIHANRTVEEDLHGSWSQDARPDLGAEELAKYMALCEQLSLVVLHEDAEDTGRWAWEPSCTYSVRSAYAIKFAGHQHDLAAMVTWQSRASRKCPFFSWLAPRNICWTSNLLARRGLPHQAQ